MPKKNPAVSVTSLGENTVNAEVPAVFAFRIRIIAADEPTAAGHATAMSRQQRR
ncbi:hypothetical protein [Kibdelosporangium phytohabitans]|uniref:hypothetical protein n=1 Tax=Kibdelosporangium phytohabitans TaxID=860235 RepID=UPI0012F88B22|nr:hypothetical protein [Kibdelosporangium phytohabitans]MBE1464236.1 hypothetical protein [Kibdelosporangium phytohabitans]